MFVACSTLSFTNEPLETALRRMAEMEFQKVGLALREEGPHLKPSEVAADPDAAVRRLRRGPGLTFATIDLDFGPVDEATYRKRFDAACRLAKQLTVAVMSVAAAPAGTSFDAEVKRLGGLVATAGREGLVLSVPTHLETLTADPAAALALCRAVPGLGLTLDPSHYLAGPHAGTGFDELFPFVQDVHLRDTGKGPDEFQVRVGQGKIDYARTVTLLERHGYDRSLTVAYHRTPESPFDVEIEVRKLKLLLESLI